MFDPNEMSPLDWDDITDEILGMAEDELRAATLLLNADPPLAAPSMPHSLMAAEYLLYLTTQLLGAPRREWSGIEEYIGFIEEKAPDLRRTLGPLTALRKDINRSVYDEETLKIAESALRAAKKAGKVLGAFIDEALEKMYEENEPEPAPSAGPGKDEFVPRDFLRAMELVDRAWQETSGKKREALAKQALSICPHAAEAYVILGNDALDGGKTEAALEYYRKGVAAGEKEIGSAFDEMKGHFWGFIETRPYMRARFGLASALRKSGADREALAHFKEMLELNPEDNQGVRYILMETLLSLGLNDEAEQLHKRYDDVTAFWVYPKALLDFRKTGDSEQSRTSRAEAVRANAHIPEFLLGRKKLPKALPDRYELGRETEAIIYAAEYGEPWRATAGAIDWLAGAV
jgi:tetratricopeptide (TPR) repeat protein